HPLFCEEWQYLIIEQISRGNRHFGCVEFGRSPFGIGIDECLLIDAAHTLDRSHIEGVLAAKVAWMSGFNLAMSNIVVLLLLQSSDLRFGQNFARFGDMTLQGCQTLLE